MRVVLSTVGRFHIFALARELERRSLLSRVYSGFPWSVLEREAVSPSFVSTFPVMRPLLIVATRMGADPNGILARSLHYLSLVTQDAYVSMISPICDVFVGHEGAGLWSGRNAQQNGAAYICDRGCSHIGWSERLIEEEYQRVGLKYPGKPYGIGRELAEYDQSDLIVVPSTYARSSFLKSNVSADKVVTIPYGVNLSIFYPSERVSKSTFDVLYVGNLSIRKGVHDLLASFEKFDYSKKRLTIVGPISNDTLRAYGPALDAPNVRVMGALDQMSVRREMADADVLVLPSIDDGFGMVMAEAMACGCPVIASAHTGAADLFDDGIEGFLVPIRSAEQIAERLDLLVAKPDLRKVMSEAAIKRVQLLGGWTAYGNRIEEAYRAAADGGNRNK